MKVADSDNKTPSLESFGYKQLLFEPIVGSGLFTAASIPLVYQFGNAYCLTYPEYVFLKKEMLLYAKEHLADKNEFGVVISSKDVVFQDIAES